MALHQRQSIVVIDDDDDDGHIHLDGIRDRDSLHERTLESASTRISKKASRQPSPSLVYANEQELICVSANSGSHSRHGPSTQVIDLSSKPRNKKASSVVTLTSSYRNNSTESFSIIEVPSASRVGSTASSTSTPLSTSPKIQSFKSSSTEGTSHNPIELGEHRSHSQASTKTLAHPSCDNILPHHSVSGREGNQCYERGRVATLNEQLIDLDELEEEANLWDDEELQFLRIENVSGDRVERNRKASIKVRWPQRNPPVVPPLTRLENFLHMRFLLRPKKTVELSDGDFLCITDIIHNKSTEQVTLRGIRYQRCKALNGMLEKKLNEVCLFLEIDLDDSREPNEQSAIEVSVDKVKTLRNIRRTNLSFPLGRNFASDQFCSPDAIAAEGGLTARWKYTCKYHSADDRWNNRWAERSLENFNEEDCTSGYGVSNDERRFQWRGDTIMGGSHVPALMDSIVSDPNPIQRHISIVSENSDPELPRNAAHPEMPRYSSPIQGQPQQKFSTAMSRKRTRSPELAIVDSHVEARQGLKEPGILQRSGSKVAKQRAASLQIIDQSPDFTTVIDLESEAFNMCLRASHSKNSNLAIHHAQNGSIAQSTVATVKTGNFPSISSWSSELATPPPAGTVHSPIKSTNRPNNRSVGQMLTFGDAFCGAGGTTRGAVMAGLKVKWGFDFWENACSTWKTNFSDAACYCMPSDEFVRMARNPTGDQAEVKVDILHLSPPCQYFSPAHTVNGVDDEMNTASLYAVLEVVKAAKPRVVTLEQTFGILGARCRWYFSSVIHMFATLRFSVRWAIVPLSTLGLPQRRHRLIIIGACPGEILPRMPPPTHSENGEDGLEPFVTVNETLSKIPPNADHHDPDRLVFTDGREMKPWDGNKILPRAMTTSGGQNYHPSGTRDFTLKEYACLQGFPLNHVFVGTGIKKQIGNAVPPCIAKVLFESIRKDLDKADGIVKSQEIMFID